MANLQTGVRVPLSYGERRREPEVLSDAPHHARRYHEPEYLPTCNYRFVGPRSVPGEAFVTEHLGPVFEPQDGTEDDAGPLVRFLGVETRKCGAAVGRNRARR